MKNIKFGTLFLILLLVGISSFAMAADEIQCIYCGNWAVPGQHDDCPKMKEKDDQIAEANNFCFFSICSVYY